MKSHITRILKILAAGGSTILLSGCLTTLPNVHSGNAELGFGVFSKDIPQVDQYDRVCNSPTAIGIRIHY